MLDGLDYYHRNGAFTPWTFGGKGFSSAIAGTRVEPPSFQFMEVAAISGDIAISITNPQQLVAVNAVPEPFTLGFVGVGLGAMWLGFFSKSRGRH